MSDTLARPHFGGLKAKPIDTPCGPMLRRHAAVLFEIPLNTLHGRLHRRKLSEEETFAPSRPHRQFIEGSVRWVRMRRGKPVAVDQTFITAWGAETLVAAAKRMGMHVTGLRNRLTGCPYGPAKQRKR